MIYLACYLVLGVCVAAGTVLAAKGKEDREDMIILGLVFFCAWPVLVLIMARKIIFIRLNEYCAWCGDKVVAYDHPQRLEIWAAHHRQCPKHPLREDINKWQERALKHENRAKTAEAELDRLRQALDGCGFKVFIEEPERR